MNHLWPAQDASRVVALMSKR